MSPYRLAAHLASAFSIYAVLFWTTLSLAAPTPQLAAAAPAVQHAAARLRGAALPLAGLIAVTAASGAVKFASAGRLTTCAVNRWPGNFDLQPTCCVRCCCASFDNTAFVMLRQSGVLLQVPLWPG